MKFNEPQTTESQGPLYTGMAPEQPLISVIIAAYNAAPFISAAIESVLCQTHQQLEILVIDDGSSDATADIVRGLKAKDERIRLFTLATNAGVSAARNFGFANARGEWFAILDADDAYLPVRLERLLSIAVKHSLDLVADNLEMRDFDTGTPKGKAFPSSWTCESTEITQESFLERDMPGMFRRELGYIKPLMRASFLKKHGICYIPDIRSGEDFLLYLDCLAKGGRLRLIPDGFYIYHLRSGSVSSVRNANLELRRGNQWLLERADAKDSYYRELLNLRQTLIEYEIFCWRIKTGKWLRAIYAAKQLPMDFLLRKLYNALLRRLRLVHVNPSQLALERLRSRYAHKEFDA